ncbi:MAG TPA: DUF87 domain-containing protein [Pyrinomonadaceae bacterium]|jgi:hypothetical protein
MSIQEGIKTHAKDEHGNQTKKWFQKLIQDKQYVGELYSINYETAKVMINNFQRERVGGIPSLSFLIATRRVNTLADEFLDYTHEDSSIVLLRVMDAAQLPQDRENERIRTEVAQRVIGETDRHWDSKGVMDAKTRNLLDTAAVECRIVGTFYLDLENEEQPDSDLVLKFGSDISNYYPNKGLKVYKPNADALKTIVNHIDSTVKADYRARFGSTTRVKLGTIRYASTNRKYQQVDNVPVEIFPADLLSQKSALFGMTRTGKSNTAKIIAKSVYELRIPKNSNDQPFKIGQIIFDPNGEYANENEQDKDRSNNVNALKNLWQQVDTVKTAAFDLKRVYLSETDETRKKEIYKQIKDLVQTEIVTYGILKHPADPFRKLMKINFYDDENLQIGKEIIDISLADQTAQYFKNFAQVVFEKPQESEFENEKEYLGQLKRFERRVLVYRTLLKKAGFEPPQNNVAIEGYFNQEVRKAMIDYTEKSYTKKQGLINQAGQTLSQKVVSWDSLASAFEGLFYFLSTDSYNKFNQNYINKNESENEDGESTGEGWADSDLESLLEMFKYSKGTNLLGKVSAQHTTTEGSDYAEDIYNDLAQGKLVIVDQSSGEPELNKSSAERIMWRIFRKNQALFREGKPPTEILVYLEEAHNLLPSGSDLDLKNVWVRTAKEGAKYRIGMVYSTQEVSSVQRNILKNTANWFIGHLNNTDETKELTKFYDFGDFENSILRTQDKGFLRVKTLSNYFVIPVQVKRFDVTDKS